MTTVNVLSAAGKKAGSVDLPAEIFDAQVNIPLIHQVVIAQQAAARQGTHATKSRGEVAGGGRKPYRQKGTGRARQGSIRAPQYTGGGIVHGPVPHGYDQRTPKKMKAAALRGALSDRARDGRVHIVEGLVDGDSPSTKAAVAALANVTQRPRTLVVLERGDDVTWLSLRNVSTIHVLAVDQLNTYDVVLSDDVVFLKGAYEQFVSGPATGKSIKAVASSSEPEAVVEIVEPAVDEKPKKAPAKKAAAKKAAQPAESTEVAETDDVEPAVDEKPKKAPAKKAAAKKAAPADDSTEVVEEEPKKAAAKKTTAKKTTAKKTTAKKATAKDDSAETPAADEDGST
jgi:large subunit ribosomal protein L4